MLGPRFRMRKMNDDDFHPFLGVQTIEFEKYEDAEARSEHDIQDRSDFRRHG